MTYLRKSVPRADGVSPGSANPKSPDVTLVYTDDILSFPERDPDGLVRLIGNIVLKPGAKMIKLYETPTSQKASHTIEGEEDMEGFQKKFEGSHPGDGLAINEFVQNTIGRGVIIIYGLSCGSNAKKVLGTPCNPMKLKGEFSDSKDGVKHTLNFEQYQSDGYVAGFYEGTLQFGSNFNVAVVTQIDLTPDNGQVYQLPATAVLANIDIDTVTLDHGKIVTLIGGGGAGASELTSGAKTGATVILKDDTDWVALAGAVINFKVVSAGATKYLVEESRQ